MRGAKRTLLGATKPKPTRDASFRQQIFRVVEISRDRIQTRTELDRPKQALAWVRKQRGRRTRVSRAKRWLIIPEHSEAEETGTVESNCLARGTRVVPPRSIQRAQQPTEAQSFSYQAQCSGLKSSRSPEQLRVRLFASLSTFPQIQHQ